MMRYIKSPSTNPCFNLALEQYVFDRLPRTQDYCMLWQNDNTIVVGKHQNTFAEINADYAREHGIRVVRRLSGGGAVYHDLGNINFTFIADHTGQGFDFSSFCRPVMEALESSGVKAELSGRNDMTIQGRKFSGNSQYIKEGRIMHHGTIMYDSDLDVVQQSLRVSGNKLASKGLPSVRSRVTNVKPHMPNPVSTEEIMERLQKFLFHENHLKPYELTEEDLQAVRQIQADRYDRWEWNYGYSPECSIRKERRMEGCGTIQVYMELENGCIRALSFYGDYFSTKESDSLIQLLLGAQFKETDIRSRLGQIDIGQFFHRLSLEQFCSILLE